MEAEKKTMEFESELNNGDHESSNKSSDHGWQKVTYAKRQRKQKPNQNASDLTKPLQDGGVPGSDNVFQKLEKKTEDRRRRIVEAQRAAEAAAASFDNGTVKSKKRSDDEDSDDSDGEERKENGKAEEAKKPKQKKPKKPKVTVADAAAKIDVSDLAAFLADVTASYEGQQDIQLMRFADYFGRAFSLVSSAQFPWMKLLRESPVAKTVDIPLSHISEPVYKTSVDWINQRSLEALGTFVLWCLESILADLSSQLAAAKGAKKGVQHASSKSQVAIFVVLAMVLRRKPDALINVLPTLRENAKYQGQDKLPVYVWMITQASQGDLAVGLYSWSHNLLPLMSGKSFNPQSRDLVLQLVERILSGPKARTILVNSAVRKGERLMPPASFEILMRATFPASSARIKATERFEAVYPVLKDVALAGAPGSKAMRQVALQVFSFALKAAGEGIPELSREASSVVLWCFSQNADCFRQWDKVYHDNLSASVAVLKKLAEDWKQLSANPSIFNTMKEILKNFRRKNEEALTTEADAARQSLFKDADKYCKTLLGKLSRGNGCIKSLAVLALALAVGAAVMSPSLESLDLKKLSAVFDSYQSF